MSTILSYKIHTVTPYINWIYFFHAWGFQPRFAAIANIHGCDACRASWLTTFPEEERNKASEAMQLFKEANRMLDLLDRDYEVKTIFKLCKANSDGDNLIIEKEKDRFITFPLLRQQTPKRDGSPFLCLSDFIRPISSGIPDTIGAFASSIDPVKTGNRQQGECLDTFRPVSPLCLNSRLWHIPTLLCAHIHASFLLDELLDMKQIGISLTENGAMYPHASVCGLMFSHPASEYFSVGKIGEDQLEDYARRRGKSIEEMCKFLAANLQ